MYIDVEEAEYDDYEDGGDGAARLPASLLGNSPSARTIMRGT